ncbi:uncharacterized protein AB675_7652 [Cyphellophora attinorum]|uniref:Uncharacterized protein n=1 Tax=Cyphellophora attinorum TaxID=1664694 RepID=A0A0N1NZC1_9EURO|nr:uncharacterized protein AB675_7652 [Phialophora attinorum]KPI40307.1 hypothetical protein AB675_7652 [Phialophora attinorum]
MADTSSPSSSPAKEDVELPDAPPATNGTSTSAEGDANKVALQDLFDQDSDDDFPTSSAMPSSPPAQGNGTTAPAVQTESYSDPTIMTQFYARLFPFRTLFQWLNHSPKPGPDFGNREFAFTLSNDATYATSHTQLTISYEKTSYASSPPASKSGPSTPPTRETGRH